LSEIGSDGATSQATQAAAMENENDTNIIIKKAFKTDL
jgi:hypothetical protein